MRISFAALWMCALSAGGCLEDPRLKGDGSGQIVVVGNGGDWSQTLVVDMEHQTSWVSYVLEKDKGFQPVMAQLNHQDVPAKLDWVAPNPQTGGALIQVGLSEMNSKAVFNQQKPLAKAEREEQLETFTFSDKISPQSLSNGALLFVNSEGELRYSADRQSSFLVTPSVVSWTSDLAGNLYVEESKNLWRVLRFEDIASKNADMTSDEWKKVPAFKADLFFVTKIGKALMLLWSEGLGMTSGLKTQKLYVFRPEEMIFSAIESFAIPRVSLLAVLPETGVRWNDSWIGLAKLKGATPVFAAAEISESGLKLLPLEMTGAEPGWKFGVARESVIAQTATERALHQCQIEKTTKLWRCQKWTDLGIAEDFAIGPQAELIVAQTQNVAAGFSVSRFALGEKEIPKPVATDTFSGDFKSLRSFQLELISEHREGGHARIKDFEPTKEPVGNR